MKVKILSSLNHDNQIHQIGDEIELPDAIALGLAEIQVVEILSTIVEVADEAVPDSASGKDSGAKAKKTAKAEEETPTGEA